VGAKPVSVRDSYVLSRDRVTNGLVHQRIAEFIVRNVDVGDRHVDLANSILFNLCKPAVRRIIWVILGPLLGKTLLSKVKIYFDRNLWCASKWVVGGELGRLSPQVCAQDVELGSRIRDSAKIFKLGIPSRPIKSGET